MLARMPFVARRPDPDNPVDVAPDPLRLAFFSVREVRQRLPQDSTARVRSPRWQLTEPYGYVAEDHRYFVVPPHAGNVSTPGQSTDLASVPGFLWGILGPYGQHLRSALLHDHLCEVANGVVAPDPGNRNANGQPIPPGRTPVQLRTEADHLFREALRSEGVGSARSWIFWTGVSYGRFFISRRLFAPAKVLGVMLAVLVFAVAVVGLHALTVVLGGGPPRVDNWLSDRTFWQVMLGIAVLMAVLRRWVLLVSLPLSLIMIVACLAGTGPGAPAVLHSLSWHAVAAGALLLAVTVLGLFTDLRVALIATVLGPLILPVVLLTLLVQVPLALPDLIGWALRGYPDEDEPVVGPTLGPPK
jgi:hypothetical protein